MRRRRIRCSTRRSWRGQGWQIEAGQAVFEQLEERYDEMLAALQWFLDQGRTDEAMRLAIARSLLDCDSAHG